MSDDYVFCAKDRFWFRPPYTEGRCPLCGEVAAGGAPPRPLVSRIDRSWFGLAALAFVWLGVSAFVVFMYFSA
ncbi:MAG TPA: hypothetical protein VGQ38_13430 [Gaiellaceae bacterium]|nr:hypothetical protein [Gaiellaceae bacterium]